MKTKKTISGVKGTSKKGKRIVGLFGGFLCLWDACASGISLRQNFMPPFVFNPQIFFSALFFIGSLISVKSLLVVDSNTPNSFRQVLHGTAGGMSPQVQARSQQLPGSTPVSTSNFIFLIVYIVWLEFLPLSLGEKKSILKILCVCLVRLISFTTPLALTGDKD